MHRDGGIIHRRGETGQRQRFAVHRQGGNTWRKRLTIDRERERIHRELSPVPDRPLAVASRSEK